MNEPRIGKGSRAGAYFGVLFGCTSWVLVLGLMCLVHGRLDGLLPVVVPMLLASLGLGLLLLHSFEPLFVAAPQPRSATGLHFTGGLLVVVGVLLLLAEAFVLPLLESDRSLADLVRRSGGVLSVPREVPTGLLLAGCVLLAWPVRRQDAAVPPGG